MQLYCTITANSGERVPMVLGDGTDIKITPTQLRKRVSETTKIPLGDLRLIFRGRMIKDDDGIADAATEYKLENDSVLHCMGKPVSNTTANTATTNDNTAAAAAAPDTTRVQNRTAVPPLSTANASSTATTENVTATVNENPSATTPTLALLNALEELRASNPPSVYATAVATLEKVLTNIVANPMEEKYRRVKRQNPAFRKRMGGLNGGHACMLACGFTVEQQATEEVYQLRASADRWNNLVETTEMVSEASTKAKVQQEQARQQPLAGFGAAAPNAMPTMGGGGSPFGVSTSGFVPPNINMNDPNTQNMMAQMMSNPEALRAALQNPMVQQMMRNDPNVSPMIQQYLNNPAVLQQMTQRLQDPNVQAQLRQAMAAGGASGMNANMGGMNTGMPGAGNNSNNNSNSAAAPPPPQNEQSQTEEEMIAEAIRRSLEDN